LTGTALVSGGGSVTSISPSLTSSTTYYAQSRNNMTGCVSTTRLPVTGTVNPIPEPPSMTGAGTHCTGAATITASVGANGNGIKWDDNSTSSSRNVMASGTYRAISTTTAGCTSSTATVTVTIGTPSASGSAPNSACRCAPGLTECSGTCQASCGMLEWPNNTCGLTHVSDVAYVATESYAAAYSLCTNLDMRLPELAELSCICNNMTVVPGGIALGTWYWSYNTKTHAPLIYQCGAIAGTTVDPSYKYGHAKCVR
jgi:hypothetical protein